MKKIFAIFKNETKKIILSKNFVISTLIIPAILILTFYIPFMLRNSQSERKREIIVILDNTMAPNNYFDIKSKIEKKYATEIYFISKDDSVYNKADYLKNFIVVILNGKTVKVEVVDKLSKGESEILYNFISGISNSDTEVKFDERNEPNNDLMLIQKAGILLSLLIVIISNGGTIVRSLVEEKNDRLLEVILSSCSSEQLLLAKVIAYTLAGILQIIVIYILNFLFNSHQFLQGYINYSKLTFVIFTIIVSYTFYVTLYISIGSLAKSEAENQNLFNIINLVIALPVILMPFISQNIIYHVIGFIPLTAPIALFTTIISESKILLSEYIKLLILFVSTLLIIKATASLFRARL